MSPSVNRSEAFCISESASGVPFARGAAGNVLAPVGQQHQELGRGGTVRAVTVRV